MPVGVGSAISNLTCGSELASGNVYLRNDVGAVDLRTAGQGAVNLRTTRDISSSSGWRGGRLGSLLDCYDSCKGFEKLCNPIFHHQEQCGDGGADVLPKPFRKHPTSSHKATARIKAICCEGSLQE